MPDLHDRAANEQDRAVTRVLDVPAPSTQRTRRASVLVTRSDQRLRLPRDLIGAAAGAVVALAAWAFVAEGVTAPVALTIPAWISWLVTAVAGCGTSVFIVAAVVLCILGRWFSLVGHVVVAAGGPALLAWGIADWSGREPRPPHRRSPPPASPSAPGSWRWGWGALVWVRRRDAL